MTKREKACLVLVAVGFLLVLLGSCLVADNPYWWVSVAVSGAGGIHAAPAAQGGQGVYPKSSVGGGDGSRCGTD